MHTLLPGSLFKSPPPHPQTTSLEAPPKLRKSRSNSDLYRDRNFAHAPPSESDNNSTADSHSNLPHPPVFVSVAATSSDPFADVVGLNDVPQPPSSASSYSGLPRPSRLSARSALETVKLSSTPTPTPKDDPLFVLYDSGRRMVAATLERWVAQLTSELDYDALLDFFLTYRSYVRARDLLQLLKGRFAWTLNEPGSTVRRIVRVRTSLAIRYWM
ncbi:hypothetical protein AURDEDRAFT_132174, partial [Auricularia subglabra TFB-10046 SS5]